MPVRANKGEWGEPYAALKILGDGKLYVADANGNRNPHEWMSIIELIRHETQDRTVSYRYQEDAPNIDIYVNDAYTITVPVSRFQIISADLSREIQNGQGAFPVSDTTQSFLDYIELLHIKARSIDKSDVFLSVRDPRAGIIRQNIGFSIKSSFGNNPTLFNTAKASAFIYKLSNMNDVLMHHINSLRDELGHAAVSARCDRLLENGCNPVFVGLPVATRARCAAFQENLDLIDPRLVTVIERLLWNHFFKHETCVDLEPLLNMIIEENPCNLSRPEAKYPYMLKSFLYAAYCGMTASSLWDGNSQVNGGFIKVNDNGEVLAHYALESDAFKSYLLKNCYLEFPSTDEKHGHYAKVYKEKGDYYFRLNFQIRYR